VVRLGDGTEESSSRMQDALTLMWPYVAEMFESDAIDDAAAGAGLGPRWSDVREDWTTEVTGVLNAAGLALPKPTAFRSTGKTGRHSEHMGFILTDMQYLQRAFPGGVW
jgi:ring-1,2-phenylacetyl-CoA epoxidase subunit PaaC